MTDGKKTAEITVPINIHAFENPPVVGTKVLQPTVRYQELSHMEKAMYDIAMAKGADPRTITRESLNDFITRSLRNMASQPTVNVEELSERVVDDILDSDIQELEGYDPEQYRHHRMGQELSDSLSKIAEGIIRVEKVVKKKIEI